MNKLYHYDSPLGGITLADEGGALAGLWFDGSKYCPPISCGAQAPAASSVFDEARRWLDLYFGEKIPDFTPKLSVHATSFREAVWEILLTIPYGKTATYGEIAGRVAARLHLPRMSAQAIGGAVARNPVSLIIPCHRVIGADGSLTGYAGGIDIKAKLLELEKNRRFSEI